MTSVDVSADLRELKATLASVEAVLDLPALRRELGELEAAAADPHLWDDAEEAQKITSRLSYVQAELKKIAGLHERLDDVEVMFELAETESDAGARSEALTELDAIRKTVDELEVRTLLSGEYDERDAVVSVRSGAGGADACDFAEQLMRMYLRWAEAHDFATEVYDVSYAEEAGIRSAAFAVNGPYAYGTLSVEQGTHRVVRISKYDNQGRRQTGFAAVEVVPALEQTDQIEVPDEEIRVDVYRSSGPGGQSVNTTDSAVRITHVPTGIVVSMQNEKSQLQNREQAMRVLRARLLAARAEAAAAEASAARRSQVRTVDRSERIRTYNFPENRIADHRTGFKAYNLDAVLDGDLAPVIRSAIEADEAARLAAAGDS